MTTQAKVDRIDRRLQEMQSQTGIMREELKDTKKMVAAALETLEFHRRTLKLNREDIDAHGEKLVTLQEEVTRIDNSDARWS